MQVIMHKFSNGEHMLVDLCKIKKRKSKEANHGAKAINTEEGVHPKGGVQPIIRGQLTEGKRPTELVYWR